MMNPPQISQPTSQSGTTDGYRWYPPPFVSPPFSAQSQAGGLSPQFSLSDLMPILTPILQVLPGVLSMLQQQGYQPAQMKAQSQAGGLSPQFSLSDLTPIFQTLPIVLSLLQQQGYQLSTPA